MLWGQLDRPVDLLSTLCETRERDSLDQTRTAREAAGRRPRTDVLPRRDGRDRSDPAEGRRRPAVAVSALRRQGPAAPVVRGGAGAVRAPEPGPGGRAAGAVDRRRAGRGGQPAGDAPGEGGAAGGGAHPRREDALSRGGCADRRTSAKFARGASVL